MAAGQQTRQMSLAEAGKLLSRGLQSLNRGDLKDAGAVARVVLKYQPKLPQAHFLVGMIALESSNWIVAGKAFQTVVELEPGHAAAWAQLARVFVIRGQYGNADIALDKAIKCQSEDPLVLDIIATVYSLTGDQKAAIACYDRVIATRDAPMFRLNRAKALVFEGDFDKAREDLQAVVSASPRAGMPHWLLSRINRAEDSAHTDQMLTLADGLNDNSPDAPFLWYAIGKELEDLGEWDRSFDAYEKGARAQRSQTDFDEAAEAELFKALKETWTPDWFAAESHGYQSDAPIFVIGQPRTGTTLVERIIAAHPDVHSAGELQQFRMAIRRLVNLPSKGVMSGEIIRATTGLDLQELGRIYMETSRTLRGDKPYFVDKMPVNYLYAPLIAKALPGARFVHLVRHPMDACFASYKQLFADAYPHSYDQEEMARHHVRYRDLMQHWHRVMPGRILDIAYEDVASEIQLQARAIIDHLDIGWHDACLEFHKQEGAVTTASAAQVREKAHTRSIGKWRRFENRLKPMSAIINDSNLL